jgi:hypothetical protein
LNRRITASSGSACIVRLSDAAIFVAAQERRKIMAPKIVALAVGLAITGASIGTAAADTPWQRRHPWREQVNHRLANLNHRINAERREGELAPRQARALRREDRAIRGQERFMAGFHDSHLTGAERRALNQEENGLSRRIGR